MTPAQRREIRRLEYRLARAMTKAKSHEDRARKEQEHTLDHWKWANHFTVEAVRLANELAALRAEAGAEVPRLRGQATGEDVR